MAEEEQTEEEQPEQKGIQEGTWKDLTEVTESVMDDGYLDYNGKRFKFKYKMVTWPQMNQITEDMITDQPNISSNPIKYERTKQELLLYQIVREFAGVPLYNEKGAGGPIMENWGKIPAPVGEELRKIFFHNTGETLERLGLNEESLLVLKKLIENLFDKNGYILKDGIVARKDNALKK